MSNKNLWKWGLGSHGTGYSVLTLAWVNGPWIPVPFDCYIIKYPPGSSIPPHRDVTKHGKHFRINLVLTHPKGGVFESETWIYKSKWLNIFRPDISTHSVSEVIDGTRYVFSIGWLWEW